MKNRSCGKRIWRVARLLGLGWIMTLPACGNAPPAEDPGTEDNAGIILPSPRRDGDRSLEATIAARRSVRSFTDRKLSDKEQGQLLWAAQGITDTTRDFRAAPSAGATYPLETYAVNPEGVYLYIPAEHALKKISAGDKRAQLAAAALGQKSVAEAPLTIVFSEVAERTTRRYGERGRMYIHMEAGHAAQNVHLQAVSLGLGSVPIGAFNPERAGQVLGIPREQTVLYMIPIGEPARGGR